MLESRALIVLRFIMTFWLVMLCVLLPVQGCRHQDNPVEPAAMGLMTSRWVDVGSSGSTSGIQVRSTNAAPTTVIDFALPVQGVVNLSILDGLDIPVVRLIDNQRLQAGYHQVSFDASNLASGVYIYRMTVHSLSDSLVVGPIVFDSSRKMMLLK